MPTTVQTMIAGTAERAAARGMLRAINEAVLRFRHSRAAERLGFAAGFSAVAIALSALARQRHLKRIEQKVDQVAEEVEEELDDIAHGS